MIRQLIKLPNLISSSRILAGPIVSLLVVNSQYPMATAVTAYAALSDWADGYIAKKYPSHASQIGPILDPIADKCFCACLASSLWIVNVLPGWLCALVIGRDLGLSLGTLYLTKGKIVKVIPSKLSKINTTVLFSLMGLCLINCSLTNVDLSFIIESTQMLAATTTVLSTLDYVTKPGIAK